MLKRKNPRDINQLAKAVVDKATLGVPEESNLVKRARTGGLSGGKARAKSLSAEERAEIAKKAAQTRWNKSSS